MSLPAMAEFNFRWLLSSVPDATLVANAQGMIVQANAFVEEMFGYTLQEMVGQPVELLLPERYRSAHVKERLEYAKMPRKRPMGAGLDLTGLRKDGTEFPLEISLSAVRTREGTLTFAAIRDITERKKTEHELEQYRNHLEELVRERTEALSNSNELLMTEIAARKRVEEQQARLLSEVAAANEELKNFAYVVSHDLKAPLRAIGSLANWIAQDYAEKFDAEGREQMALLVNRVYRMDKLIDGILAYSRLGSIREDKVQIDLNEAVREAIDLISPPPEYTIRVIDPLPTLVAERTRMVQLFQNLLSNAIRHNDKPEGWVEIRCQEEPGQWQISISDNGPGIDPRHHEKIFQMFQTLAPRDRMESTGIGLTLVKRIVEMSGGRIWVESRPGDGATFHFTLPRPHD